MNNLSNVICLSSPHVGIVLNSECKTRAQAETLLADRIANGEAFADEHVRVTSRARYRAAHGDADRVATGDEWRQAQNIPLGC